MRSRRPAVATWVRSCAAVVAALVLVGCGAPAAPVEPRHPPRCATLLFLGVRGSGEDPSQQLAMGTTVYPIYAALRGADRRIVGYGWAYHGERPTLAQLSRAATGFADFLNNRARQCPAEQVVLAGYSAGAALRSRLVAAVLLADPEFNPADARAAAGTFDPRYGGSPRRAAFPTTLVGRIRSYCRRH